MLRPVIRPSSRFFLHALLGPLVIAGCSITVQPIRTPARPDHAATTPASEAPSATTPAPLTELPTASCPDEPPRPVLDTSAKFVLQNGHERSITLVALSADGRTLASAGFDGTVRVWDVRAGLLLRKVGTAGVFVNGLSLSADGKRLAYYAPDGSPEGLAIRIVDLDKPDPPRTITPIYGAFKLSADGKRLAIAVNNLWIFDVDSGKQLFEVPLNLKSSMALDLTFDEKQHRIAIATPGEAAVIDAEKGMVLHRLTTNYSSLSDTPGRIEFHKDSVLIRSRVGVITQYPIGSATPPTTLPGTYADMAVAGDRLWVCDTTTADVSAFALPNLHPIALPPSNPARAELIAASSDESTVVFATQRLDPNFRQKMPHRDAGTVINARDAASFRPVRTIEGRATGIDALAVNPKGNELVTSSLYGELGRWGLLTGARAVPLPDQERDRGRTLGLVFPPNGEFFVTTHGTKMIRARDASTGLSVRHWAVDRDHDVRFVGFIPQTAQLLTVAHHIKREISKTQKMPNGMPVVIETFDSIVQKWDLSGPTPAKKSEAHAILAPPTDTKIGQTPHEATSVAMSPKGDQLALLGGNTIALMRVATGTVSWVVPVQTIVFGATKQPDGAIEIHGRSGTFSPDGKKLILSTRRLETRPNRPQAWLPVLLVFDTTSGRLMATHYVDTYGPVAWRKDKLFVGGYRPAIFETSKMTFRTRVAALDNMITTVSLHPTRDLFVIGGDGGATSFVDENGALTASLVATPNGEWMAATSDGAYRSSIDGSRSIAWSFSSPLEGFSFERFAAGFNKPDVVSRRLMGESSPQSVSLARPPRLFVKDALGTVMRTPNRSISLTTRASSASRVDRVRAFVDGRPVAESLVCAREGQATLEIPLHSGQNRVGLVAYDAAGQASNTENLDVISASKSAEKPHLYVIAIGVSQYPNMPIEQQLDFADDDARSVSEALLRHAGSDKPFAKVFPTLLLDNKVTVKSVEDAIDSLRAMGPEDLAVVFFAGHGAKLAEGKMVFLTSQASFTRAQAELHGVGWDKIQRSLSGVRGRVLMMLDACHSGYLTTEIVAPNEDLARQLTAGDRAGVFIFSAARGSQFSFEVPVNEKISARRGLELAWNDGEKPAPKAVELAGGHGLFTSALLEALDGDSPDRDRSGGTEIGELVDYVTERVRAASNGKQTPWVARREMFGEFFVVPAKN